MSAPENWRFETKQIHSGAQPDPVTKARATPIYQTTSYVFDSTTHAANLFALAEFGNIYTRIQNPTQDVVEQRVAALEGGTGALLLASGQAAETIAVLNIAEAGDHIVSSSSIYGGTYNLFKYTLKKLGIDVTFVENQDDAEEWRAAVRPNTKLFFAETIGNPKINILDIRLVADVAHENGIPLIVDNTIATPYLIKPFEFGADIVVHSATKFLGGHGTVIGGVIVDGGSFEWSKNVDKFPGLTVPDPSYHGASYTAAVGDGLAYIIKARVQLLRDLGAAISPQSAWLLIQGIETLSLRIERHVQNAQEIAEWLENQSDVATVNYSGLPTSPWYAKANEVRAQGRRRRAVVRAEGRRGGRARVRQRADAVQPPREHRRRALARHPPRLDDALAAHSRAAAHDRRHAGPRAPLARTREHRRPQGRPGAGARRRPPGRRRPRAPESRSTEHRMPRPRPGRGIRRFIRGSDCSAGDPTSGAPRQGARSVIHRLGNPSCSPSIENSVGPWWVCSSFHSPNGSCFSRMQLDRLGAPLVALGTCECGSSRAHAGRRSTSASGTTAW